MTKHANAELQTELFVVQTIHNGSNWAVRHATTEEIDEELRTHEGWSMPYDAAVSLARDTVRRLNAERPPGTSPCRWYDFSGDPAPENPDEWDG